LLQSINKALQRLAIFLQVFWVFFPGILFLLIAYFFFNNTLQGIDIIITGLDSRKTGLLFLIGLLFWATVTWYTSRLIAYNNDRLFHIAKEELYQTPRLLGYGCFTIIICALVKLRFGIENGFLIATFIIASFLLFVVLHFLFEKIKNKIDREDLKKYRKIVWIAYVFIIMAIVLINRLDYYIILIPLLQIGYLYAVVTRRKISQTNISKNKLPDHKHILTARYQYRKLIGWIFHDRARIEDPLKKEIMVQTEKNIFFLFSCFSLIALGIYIAAIYSLAFSRSLTALPIILLSFGILLGAGNIIALFSIKQKINFHFLLIVAVIIAGFLREPHFVSLRSNDIKEHHIPTRPTLQAHFFDWMNERKKLLDDSSTEIFPIYFILADGGASRSAFWTASVLAKIEHETNGKFSKNIFCLSGASGGSLGNMTFYGSKQVSGEISTKEVQEYLSNDFLSFPLVRLLGPDLLLPLIPQAVVKDRAEALEKSLTNVSTGKNVAAFMNENFSVLFSNKESTVKQPVICINCTRMQDGAPAVISNVQLNASSNSSRVDVLEILEPNEDISIASSIVLGARFPYFSPAGRIKEQYFVDGGYFDNSGAGVVHEMILDLNKMISDTLQKNPNHHFGKVRFHVIHISNQIEAEKKFTKVHPIINDLGAPIKTILGSYSSQTDINNLRLSKNLQDIYHSDEYYTVLNLYKKNQSEVYPMNWSISSHSLEKIKERLNKNEELDKLIKKIKTN
jgi:hypothetical protein